MLAVRIPSFWQAVASYLWSSHTSQNLGQYVDEKALGFQVHVAAHLNQDRHCY